MGSFIPTEAVLKARKTIAGPYGPIVLGIDPARGGGDKTGIIDRHGRKLGDATLSQRCRHCAGRQR